MGGNKKQPKERQLSFFKDVVVLPKLSPNDYRVLRLLESGHYTVVEIGEILRLPDPRSNIRYLRNAGYVISDYWVKTEYSRCKKYFIKHI